MHAQVFVQRDCADMKLRVNLRPNHERRAEAPVGSDEKWGDLLRRANAGDQRAFGLFLHEVCPSIRTIIRNKGASLPADQHEDILQEVLLALHLKRTTWKDGAPVKPWVYAIARYKVIDAFRKRGHAVHMPIEPFAETLEDDQSLPPLAGKDAEHLLGQIDSKSATIVRSITLEGETAEATGEKVGLTAGATRVALHRALKQLSKFAERIK